MSGILGLVGARAARRRSAAALVAISVAGSMVVLGSLLGVGVLTVDRATRQALADLSPSERVIGIHRSSEDGTGGDEADQVARAALQPVASLTQPITTFSLFQPPRDPVRVLVVDQVDRWVGVTSGRLPRPCDGGATCEALSLGAFELPDFGGGLGSTVTLGSMHVNVVGTGQASGELPLDAIRPDGIVLVVDGVTAMGHAGSVMDQPRTDYWLAPLDPNQVHGWSLPDLQAGIAEVQRAIAPAGREYLVTTPEQTLALVQGRTDVAIGRLVFISSLIVGVLLAFAVFAAAVERTDAGHEERRLRSAGATGAQRLAFIVAEAVLPALTGAIIGELLAALAVGLIAASQAAPVGTVVLLALTSPTSIALALLLAGLATAAVAIGIHPSTGSLVQPRIVATAAVPALLVLAWERATSGSGGGGGDVGSGIGSGVGATASPLDPGTVLLPGLLGLTVILASLVLLPPVFRALARAARRFPLTLRLAVISIAREPLRPAATLTLLAFSLGAVVFGLVYAATLRQGAADQAAFSVGMDVRIQTLSAEGRLATEVLPLLRQGAAGPNLEVHPMVRLDGDSATHRSFTLAGIEAAAIPELRGWRSDFSTSTPQALASAIALPGEWQLAGEAIPAGTTAVTIDVLATGDPIHLAMVVEGANGAFDYRQMGDLAGGHQQFVVPVTNADAKVVGILASNGGLAAVGGPFSGNRQQADVTIGGLATIIDPAKTIHLDVSGERSAQLLRAPARTDGLVLPAIVSPELAGDVGADGILDVTVGNGLALRLKPVGVATRIPTLLDPGPDGAVAVDLEPLLLAMNARDPGSGVPNQILVRAPSDEAANAAATALGKDPFPPVIVQSRPALEAARDDDPFAVGILWGLAAGAVAGIVLSLAGVLMAAAAELRDERGELWELEAEGLVPRRIARLLVLRTGLLAGSGAVLGIVIGIALAWLAAQTISSSTGADPVPPLVLVAPAIQIVGLAAAVLVAIGVAIVLLAARHFAAPSLGAEAR